MRQAIAEAGVYALDHNVERLAVDHANARRLAEGLAKIVGISIAPGEVETNTVYFAIDPARRSAPELSRRLLVAHGVRVGPVDGETLRAVTHLDVSAAGIEGAIQGVQEVLAAQCIRVDIHIIEFPMREIPYCAWHSGVGHQLRDAIVVPIVITPLLRTRRDAADKLHSIASFYPAGGSDRAKSAIVSN